MLGMPLFNSKGSDELDHRREPCPDRILDDAGSAFAMGAVGGTIWHFFSGMRNTPGSIVSGTRFKGALSVSDPTSQRAGAARCVADFVSPSGFFRPSRRPDRNAATPVRGGPPSFLPPPLPIVTTRG